MKKLSKSLSAKLSKFKENSFYIQVPNRLGNGRQGKTGKTVQVMLIEDVNEMRELFTSYILNGRV